MKLNSRSVALCVAGQLMLLAMMFSGPLGIAQLGETVLLVAGMVCLLLGLRGLRASGVVSLDGREKRKRLGFVMMVSGVVSASMPFWVPLLGIRLPPVAVLGLALFSFALITGLTALLLWRMK